MYGLQTLALTKKSGAQAGGSRVDDVKIMFGPGWAGLEMRTAEVEQFGDQVRDAMLRWFGHVQRRDSG